MSTEGGVVSQPFPWGSTAIPYIQLFNQAFDYLLKEELVQGYNNIVKYFGGLCPHKDIVCDCLFLLLFQDSTGMKLWKKRWFVLSDMCLFYYRGETHTHTHSKRYTRSKFEYRTSTRCIIASSKMQTYLLRT